MVAAAPGTISGTDRLTEAEGGAQRVRCCEGSAAPSPSRQRMQALGPSPGSWGSRGSQCQRAASAGGQQRKGRTVSSQVGRGRSGQAGLTTPTHIVHEVLIPAQAEEQGLQDLDGNVVGLGLELDAGLAELGACGWGNGGGAAWGEVELGSVACARPTWRGGAVGARRQGAAWSRSSVGTIFCSASPPGQCTASGFYRARSGLDPSSSLTQGLRPLLALKALVFEVVAQRAIAAHAEPLPQPVACT